MRVPRLAVCLILSTACGDCDLSGEKAAEKEIHSAQAELARLFVPPPSVHFDMKTAGGEDVVDVSLKFDKPPTGYTVDEARANANIVVRKHVHHVRDVTVSF